MKLIYLGVCEHESPVHFAKYSIYIYKCDTMRMWMCATHHHLKEKGNEIVIVYKTKLQKKTFPRLQKRTDFVFFSLLRRRINRNENAEMCMRNMVTVWLPKFMRRKCYNWFCNLMQFIMRSNLKPMFYYCSCCYFPLSCMSMVNMFWQSKGVDLHYIRCKCSTYLLDT